MTATITYEGKLRTRAVHDQSGTAIETDAPRDNQGRGERFSPTDLVATALGSCMLTIMGIEAQKKGIAIEGTEVTVEKIMGTGPRRIVEVNVTFRFQRRYSSGEQQLLEAAARECPVARSLHPDLRQTILFAWPE